MTAQIHEILILDRKPRKEASMAYCPPLPQHLDIIVDVTPDDDEYDDSTDRIRNSTHVGAAIKGHGKSETVVFISCRSKVATA